MSSYGLKALAERTVKNKRAQSIWSSFTSIRSNSCLSVVILLISGSATQSGIKPCQGSALFRMIMIIHISMYNAVVTTSTGHPHMWRLSTTCLSVGGDLKSAPSFYLVFLAAIVISFIALSFSYLNHNSSCSFSLLEHSPFTLCFTTIYPFCCCVVCTFSVCQSPLTTK